MADIYYILPHFLAYKGLKSTNSVRIRFNHIEESKYEIMIPFEWKKINTAAIRRKNCTPNFDPNHAFLSSLEAEIITFLPKKAAILFFCLLRPSYRYFNMAPLPELLVRPQRPLIPKMVLLSAL